MLPQMNFSSDISNELMPSGSKKWNLQNFSKKISVPIVSLSLEGKSHLLRYLFYMAGLLFSPKDEKPLAWAHVTIFSSHY